MVSFLFYLYMLIMLCDFNFYFFLYLLNFFFIKFFPYFSSLFFGWFYVDVYSFMMILLLNWIVLLMLMVSGFMGGSNKSELFFILKVMVMVLVMTFLVSFLICFYFFFEFSLIPTMLLIGGWGYQYERSEALLYFFFYTFSFSLPLLFFFIYMWFELGYLSFILFYNLFVDYFLFKLFYLFIMLAFLVKIPLFFFHVWLPKAHVEAPVIGSMILAGVLLKLGGYGIFRILGLILSWVVGFKVLLMSFVVVSLVFTNLLCLRLNDQKMIVAYSSVGHMSLVLLGFFSLFSVGGFSALLMMISHGLTSSGLFYMLGGFYGWSFSRSFFLSKGFKFMYYYMAFYFMMIMINFSAPPSLGFFSEVFIFFLVLSYSYESLIVMVFGLLLGVGVSLYLFSLIYFGLGFSLSYYYMLGEFILYHVCFMHLFPLILVSLKLVFFI